ncbi:hypothetical protein Syun_023081 [Stephania yunnanensis]|uniref:C2H2-type domain-containing protein n=1 Tax=Stephania yunnanensis TaxID=152371 RepID=A0AAP0I388_9MAGN
MTSVTRVFVRYEMCFIRGTINISHSRRSSLDLLICGVCSACKAKDSDLNLHLRTYSDSARSECNLYCLDCKRDAFCFYYRSSRHKDHVVIQIKRSSYHDVVRVAEIQNVLDIVGV